MFSATRHVFNSSIQERNYMKKSKNKTLHRLYGKNYTLILIKATIKVLSQKQ